ncbi:MAG: VanW family protein [Candidatus Doudnabacteria bacterium]|nr:VanW family protein [Candidatus Doudnabacteria bacterium]
MSAAAQSLLPTESFKLGFKDQVFELKTETLKSSSGNFSLPQSSNIVEPKRTQEDLENLMIKKTGPKQNFSLRFDHDPAAIFNFVENTANAVEKPVTEPILKIEKNFVTEFVPPSDGVSVDRVQATLEILKSLKQKTASSSLVYFSTSPTKKLSEINNLGIQELIAQGTSNFKGSPKNRKHNIKVGVEKFKGLIIKQGEEFSFNKYLGPVEKEAGFLPELVIKKSGTVPELGGGLCQVSSTTFRAAMEAGLPITQRKNHSYAVQYYAPQGTDATIYPGVIDLKFKNDTPGDILVWPYFLEGDILKFDFYGTKDSRTVTLNKPYQYDRKTDGSMKAEWTRIVTKDGTTSTSTFKSVYLSPALFHKEEQFVTAPTPANP